MTLYDIYKHKTNGSIIQIDSYASHLGNMLDPKESIVVFRQIEQIDEFTAGSCPSFNGYGTAEEIEAEYELFIPAKDLTKYDNYLDIVKKAQEET